MQVGTHGEAWGFGKKLEDTFLTGFLGLEKPGVHMMASAHGLIAFLQSPCSAGPLMTTGLLDLRLVLGQGQDST